jgi:hypothetical protein
MERLLSRAPLALLGVAAVACAPMSDRLQPASPAAAVVQAQLDAYNAHDLDAFVATYSDDVTIFRPPATTAAITGKMQLAEFYRDSRFNIPQLHAELLHRSVLGDTVVDHERITGLGPKPVEAVAAYLVHDGRITHVWLFRAE